MGLRSLLLPHNIFSYIFIEAISKPLGPSYRCEEHGEEVDHGLHVEAPLGSHTGRGQEHQAADGGKQHLGYKRTHAAVVQWATAQLSSAATVQSRGG